MRLLMWVLGTSIWVLSNSNVLVSLVFVVVYQLDWSRAHLERGNLNENACIKLAFRQVYGAFS